MDLVDGMRTFSAAVEAGSFTAAAERLGVSKKLVSKYVAELENRLGARLLHRTTRRLSLTDAGQRYFARCAELIEALDALETEVREDRKALVGTLRIAVPATFGELYVQPMIREFRAGHPGLTIDLRLGDRYVDLADEGFDLAIRIGALEESSLIARRLSATELWAIGAPDYFARCGRPATPRDLGRHSCLRDTNLRAGAAWPFMLNGQVQRFQVNGGYLVNSARAVRDLAVAGEGIGLCPDYVVAGDVAAGLLERVLADHPSLTLDIHAVFLNVRHLPAKTRAMLDHFGIRLRNCRDWSALLPVTAGIPAPAGPSATVQ